MYIYILAFFLSSFLFYISTKFEKRKIIQILLVITALLIPCLLAGLRSENIGTDVKVYVRPLFNCAKKASSIKEFYSLGWSIIYRIKKVYEYEYGFSFLIYIITKIFKNIQCVLFFIQALTVVPIYLALRKYEKYNDKIWLGMLMYYFIFFSFSLNAMRQMIGIAIVFYAFSILINGKKKDWLFLLLVLVATLFHKSSLLGLLIYISYKLILYQDKININVKIGKYNISLFKLLLIFLIIGGIFIVFNRDLLLSLLTAFGLDKYSGYLANQISISYLQIVIRIPLIYFYVTQYKNMVKQNKNYTIFLVIFIIDLLVSNLSSSGKNSSRISVIFNFFTIISIPILSSVSKNNKLNILNKTAIICYSMIYWYVIYIYLGACNVYPYKFFY